MMLRAGLLAVAFCVGGCCGDTSAEIDVHVVDAETGLPVASAVVEVDGQLVSCGDGIQSLSGGAPDSDDAGGGEDAPDAGTQPTGCTTYSGILDPGTYTVQVSADGYLGNAVAVSLGSGGSSFSCPNPEDVETTIALYPKLQ